MSLGSKERLKRLRFDQIQVLVLDPSGIDYLDENGQKARIEFQKCIENWRIKSLIPVSQVRMGDWNHRTVAVSARRNKPPYIEFYTQPHTRFEFNATKRGRQELTSLERRIWEAGVDTFPLG